MLTPKLQLLHRTIKRLMRRDAVGALARIVSKTHAADLAHLLADLSGTERQLLLQHCANEEQRVAVVAAAEPAVAASIVSDMKPEVAVEMLHRIEPDDVSDILEHMEQAVADALLERMRAADRREVEDLSRYEPATAGGIMSPRFFSLHRDTTSKQAIERLQQIVDELEMVFYLYVVNEVDQLLGVVSLRQLVTARPNTTLFELMTSDLISVMPEVDQEEVARLASRYGLLAIPVVDPANKLLGIVTVDDVIDVLREEATEDILRMAGAGDELSPEQSMLRSAISRLPWIGAAALGGVASACVVAWNARTVRDCLPLVFFLPALLGLSGIVGLQSATTITQSVVQGRTEAGLWRPALRQLFLAILLSSLCALLAAGAGALWIRWPALHAQTVYPATVAGVGFLVAMVSAACLGSLLPLFFMRLRLDPTLASGPLGAVTIDLVALYLFLTVARVGFNVCGPLCGGVS